MAEAKKTQSAPVKAEPVQAESTQDRLPDEAKTAAMLRREAKQARMAGEMKLWEQQQKEKESE